MKGILFKPDMIKAIVEGRKTQTRRLDGPKEINQEPDRWTCNGWAGSWQGFAFSDKSSATTSRIAKPRYQVGEVVYIKETHYRYGHWEETSEFTKTGRVEWQFIAETNEVRYKENRPDRVNRATLRMTGWYKRSPLFMSEWAARRFIKFTGVGAERLQEITEEDCLAEGIYSNSIYKDFGFHWESKDSGYETAEIAYIILWNSINPKYPWAMNPWVFPYSFKRVEAEK